MKKVFLLCTLALILSLQYRLWIGEGSFAHVESLKNRVDKMRIVNLNIAHTNMLLKEDIKDLRVGLDSIEEKARSDFGLIKKNETFFLLVDD